MIKKYFHAIISLVAIILILSVVACDPARKLEKQEREDIQAFLGANDTIDFVKQQSGLYYYEVVGGTGISPVIADSVYINYKAMFLNGTVFDSNATTGKLYGNLVYKFISGFAEGLTLMKQGGKSTLLIPSSLAYGSGGNYDISGYTPLLFEVELVKVVKYSVDWDH
jgi:FKBP-type peptidyl-prolyl cis-trans isomerase FkpA